MAQFVLKPNRPARASGLALNQRPSRALLCFGVCALLLLIFALCGVATAQKKHPAKPVDLNGATAQQLELVPGIGPATAQSIVRFREKSGPFQRVEDLLAIRGISRTKLEKMRPYLTITQPIRRSPPD